MSHSILTNRPSSSGNRCRSLAILGQFLSLALVLGPRGASGADGATHDLPHLRLAGVTALDRTLTAYFSDVQKGFVFTLKIGETGPGGYKLIRLDRPDDPVASCAVLVRGNQVARVSSGADGQNLSEETVFELIEADGDEADGDDDSERVAVRPWKDPNAP